MPRRRRLPSCDGCGEAAALSSGSNSGASAMSGQPRKNAFASVTLFADPCLPLGIERQVEVHPRAEADEAEALAFPELGAALDIAEDAARDQSRHLDAGHILAIRGLQPQRIALVLQRRLVERGIDEGAREIPAL